MLARMGRAYGAYKMNVLVITAVIIVTITLPGDVEKTMSRRIANEGSTDFDRLEALSKLCEECCQTPLPARELRRRLDRIKGKPFPKLSLYLGGALSAGGFAIFFGGTILDGIMSAVIALFVCVALKYFRPITPNTIVFNFATSLVTGLIICLVARLVPHMSIDMAIIGVIMLLIPGVATRTRRATCYRATPYPASCVSSRACCGPRLSRSASWPRSGSHRWCRGG